MTPLKGLEPSSTSKSKTILYINLPNTVFVPLHEPIRNWTFQTTLSLSGQTRIILAIGQIFSMCIYLY